MMTDNTDKTDVEKIVSEIERLRADADADADADAADGSAQLKRPRGDDAVDDVDDDGSAQLKRCKTVARRCQTFSQTVSSSIEHSTVYTRPETNEAEIPLDSGDARDAYLGTFGKQSEFDPVKWIEFRREFDEAIRNVIESRPTDFRDAKISEQDPFWYRLDGQLCSTASPSFIIGRAKGVVDIYVSRPHETMMPNGETHISDSISRVHCLVYVTRDWIVILDGWSVCGTAAKRLILDRQPRFSVVSSDSRRNILIVRRGVPIKIDLHGGSRVDPHAAVQLILDVPREEGDDRKRMCAVCWAVPPTTIHYKPCGHSSMCAECSSVIMASATPQCPICRADIARVVDNPRGEFHTMVG